MRRTTTRVVALGLALVAVGAGTVGCSDGDDGADDEGASGGGAGGAEGGGCGGDPLVVAFDHETIDPDRGIGGGVPEISVATDGGEPEMITGDWVVSQPDFSPEGDRLVVVKAEGDYESAGPDATALWIIGTDGIDATEPVELTSGDVLDEDPDWSPDGTTVVFSRLVLDPEGDYEHRIMTVPAEGGDPEVVVTASEDDEQLDEPAWSPDGTRLAYIQSLYDEVTNETATTVWTVGADGSGAAPLVTMPYIDDVSWHPDGTSLLVGQGDGFAVADPGTGTVEPIAGELRAAVWAPDGEHVYHARPDREDGSERGIQRSRVEDGQLVDTEDVTLGRRPSFGLAVSPCG